MNGSTDSYGLTRTLSELVRDEFAHVQTEDESIEINPDSPETNRPTLAEMDEPAQIALVEHPPPLSDSTLVTTAVVSDGNSTVSEKEAPRIEEFGQTLIEAQEQIAPKIQPDAKSTITEAVSPDAAQDIKKRTRPPRYSPSIRTGQVTRPRQPERSAGVESSRTHSLSMRVRIVFRRRNYQFSLLPQRVDDLPEELEVTSANGGETWGAYQDEWYQEIMPSNLNGLLEQGGIWESTDGKLRWVLSGREIYVLAPESTISGFVQTSGLALGQDHAVLCTEGHHDAVRNALLDAGCSDLTPIANSSGVPEGWILFTDIRPSVAIEHEKDAGIYNILRPVHDVRIDCTGGIRLSHSTWLSRYPPKVRVLGASDSNLDVLIDGQTASVDADGNYTASDWDSDGHHVVFSGGNSESYEIATGSEDWEFFEGDSYRQGPNLGNRISICGPVVLPTNNDNQLLLLPSGNNCLVGAVPGQIVVAAQPPNIRRPCVLAQSDFEVVWTLPADPLRCDKASSRVRLMKSVGPGSPTSLSSRHERWAAFRWYRAILDASRKGLRIDPDTEDATNLWLQYKRRARELRRLLR